MGLVGGRRGSALALVAALAGAALTGCADTVDGARTVQTHLGRVHEVVAVQVTPPTPDHAPAIRVTYGARIDSPTTLGDLVDEVEKVADRLDYPARRVTLVPADAPTSALTVGSDLGDGAARTDALTTWFAVTTALLGPVTYDVERDAETITVTSGGGAAHDVAEAQRIGRGGSRTTWVFRAGSSTFTAGGRLRPSDVALFQAVQRNAGVSGQPVWAKAWQLDRRGTHVRLDLDLAFGTALVAPAQLTTARYGRTVAPTARVSLVALARTGLPAMLSLHCGSDTFAAWESGQPPGQGRDPLGRGWDPWLAQQAAAVT
ncbi:hypothetical protein [Nocardioides hankookensis]|uniref:GerMN domain-containing protein n=1 Tax=Nocardioides hankookensis TaxID=443157 RepID=A0ABW1LDK0_9ACTN